MRVVIAGGRSRTDFLVESLVRGGSQVVAVNNDRAWCEYLSSRHDIAVVCGDATKRYVLDDADIEGFDLVIALSDSDADNLVICQLAQRFFGVRRQVCTAYNPRNVAVFKKLGISSVVSATFVLSKLIEEASFAALGENRASSFDRVREGAFGRRRRGAEHCPDRADDLDATAGLRRVLSDGFRAAEESGRERGGFQGTPGPFGASDVQDDPFWDGEGGRDGGHRA